MLYIFSLPVLFFSIFQTVIFVPAAFSCESSNLLAPRQAAIPFSQSSYLASNLSHGQRVEKKEGNDLSISDFARAYSFYESSESELPSKKVVLVKSRTAYFLFENNGVRKLGVILEEEKDAEILKTFANAVSNGNVVIAYWNKKKIPEALVENSQGLVYRVRHHRHRTISIEYLGMSSLENSNESSLSSHF